MTAEPKTTPPSQTENESVSLALWAQAFSLLDDEVFEEEDYTGTSFGKHSMRWSEKFIKERYKHIKENERTDKYDSVHDDLKKRPELLRNLLTGKYCSLDFFYDQLPLGYSWNKRWGGRCWHKFEYNLQYNLQSTIIKNNLWDTVKSALENAIQISYQESPDEKNYSAGAVYLYDEEHDELVMAASKGFPLVWNETSGVKNHLGYLDKKDEGKQEAGDLRANLGRLLYIKKIVGKQIRKKTIQRDSWVLDELKGWYEFDEKENENIELDCNDLLPGVAYYKPGSGITGMLFDKQKGPNLEREILAENNLGENIQNLFKKNIPPPLESHFSKELLRKRTLIYEKREDMAPGRQVRAGTYEGMQFPPGSRFIGPFLGAVLRFNGEHLGILKVERHKFNGSTTDSGQNERTTDVCKYTADEIGNFIVYSYVISGLLYVLKHHGGIDLRDAWTQRPD